MDPLTFDADSPLRPTSRIGDPTWEMTLFFPRQGEWTEADYLSLGTNWMIEYSDGCLEVLPMPTLLHQLIVEFLHTKLKAFIEAHGIPGRALFAPLPIRLWPKKYREPDVVFLRPERLRNLGGQPEGADVVMEVVSEGTENRQRDLEIKPQEYAAAGILEYWTVDPARQQVSVLTLNGNEYRSHGAFGRGELATSVFFPGFAIDVNEIFDIGESIK
ncbi:MAG: Uma2 family endonuclease [Planctomycetales bacterium]|nr:Uma2 family endonuclease [Planctomycetales bacterium]